VSPTLLRLFELSQDQAELSLPRSSRLGLYRERLGQCRGESIFYISDSILNAFYEKPCNKYKAIFIHEYLNTPWKIASTVAAIVRNYVICHDLNRDARQGESKWIESKPSWPSGGRNQLDYSSMFQDLARVCLLCLRTSADRGVKVHIVLTGRNELGLGGSIFRGMVCPHGTEMNSALVAEEFKRVRSSRPGQVEAEMDSALTKGGFLFGFSRAIVVKEFDTYMRKIRGRKSFDECVDLSV
ncbi:hypothetical protein CR513_41264, partial [Mucuna pruriens]